MILVLFKFYINKIKSLPKLKYLIYLLKSIQSNYFSLNWIYSFFYINYFYPSEVADGHAWENDNNM